MTDFQSFIEVNKILKKEIASYLGVSNAFITQLCDGSKKIPAQKLALIKANDRGWDTSMFESSHTVGDNNSGVVINGGGNNSHIDNRHYYVVINGGGNNSHIDNRHYYSDRPDVLRAQIDILEEWLKEKDAQIKEKDAQIKQLLDILQGLKSQ